MDFLDILFTFLASLLAAIIFMSCIFVVGRRMQRYDIVDVAWGLVFIVIAATSLLFNGARDLVQFFVLGLVIIWGLRLSYHIYRRLRATTSEDKRYVELRKKWHASNEDTAIYLRIYVIQAVLACLVCLPIIILNTSDALIYQPFVIAGAAIWLIGFCIETVADRQLRHFIRSPKDHGQLMTRGLWRYSRHPNYFGELTLWWGVGIIALSAPFGWLGLIGPVVISYLIIFVSGIPPTEKSFAGRVGWDKYKRETSALVPWFVRKTD